MFMLYADGQTIGDLLLYIIEDVRRAHETMMGSWMMLRRVISVIKKNLAIFTPLFQYI